MEQPLKLYSSIRVKAGSQYDMTLDVHNMTLDNVRPYVSVYRNNSVAQIRKWQLKSSCSDILLTALE